MMLSIKYQKMTVESLQEEVEEEVEDEDLVEEAEEEVEVLGEDVVKVEGEEEGTFVNTVFRIILQC